MSATSFGRAQRISTGLTSRCFPFVTEYCCKGDGDRLTRKTFAPSASHRRARFEDRPVERFDVLRVRRECRLERERELRRAVLLQMGEALLRFVDARYVAARHPPQRDEGTAELLEPVAAPAEQFGVRGFVDIRPQRFDRFPDREI